MGAVVSAAAAVVVEEHIEVADRQTVSVEHLRQQQTVCVQHIWLVGQDVFGSFISNYVTSNVKHDI